MKSKIWKIIGWVCLILAILAFFTSLSLEIHEPTMGHLWNALVNIALIVVSVSLIRGEL
jgi:hypothetical protein